jgi:hypothetical protein
MRDGILDLHRGVVDLLKHADVSVRIVTASKAAATHFELPVLLEVTVHLDLDRIQLENCSRQRNDPADPTDLRRGRADARKEPLVWSSDELAPFPGAQVACRDLRIYAGQRAQHARQPLPSNDLDAEPTGCNRAYSLLSNQSFASFRLDFVDNLCKSSYQRHSAQIRRDLRKFRLYKLAHLVFRFLACDTGGFVELLQRVQRDFRGYVRVLLISATLAKASFTARPMLDHREMRLTFPSPPT